ncbi:uncharacterized protein LOC107847707 isoform X1 [Capsicum annuum]|uniref:uncharacterized protein LOC107847707 isoform X1 n=1 Tax=Capsicum annuum TaxID=4072 RepID=UPI001FB19D49|nr:uncharacterized protein LOC107847707 isoform X1 [Capsicum annuum]
MASQVMLINLANSESEHESLGLHQNRAISSIRRLGRRIELIRGIMTDIQGSVEMPPGFPESLLEADFNPPIHTMESPILTTLPVPVCDTHMPPSQFSIAFLKALIELINTSEDKDMEGQVPNYEVGLSQQPKMNKSSKSREEDKRIKGWNFPLYDGLGNPHSHLKEYLDKLSVIGKSDSLKTKLFVSSLKGPTLMWYTENDTSKWVSWDYLATNFVRWFNNKLKRKFTVEVNLVKP